ncbi:hypothetical protein QZH41_011521, partial [Actinostola sp. cb2023]
FIKMSRLYDTIEPSVIDELMLKQAVEEQGPRGEAGRLAKQEGIDFRDVLSLRLDFKNILKIDNLWSFVNLTRLQLDNNIIEKIEGLDLLVNLEWLDLSFNNIEVLEGLNKITKLKDLTLYNNRISKIENMDSLVALHVFSIGNNSLKQLDNVLYLRRFKNLRTLNLSSNPFCEDVSYKEYVIAHLPELVYLDFRLVDSTAREVATEKYMYSIEELVHDETVALRKHAETKDRENERLLHKDAYVEDLDSANLFDSMYSDDPDGAKLSTLPGMDEVISAYPLNRQMERFVAICRDIFEFGLKECTKRKEDIKSFFTSMDEALAENKKDGVAYIQKYIDFKKKVNNGSSINLYLLCHDMLALIDYSNTSDVTFLESMMKEIVDKIAKLWDSLMGLEMQLVDQLELAPPGQPSFVRVKMGIDYRLFI